MTSTCTVIVGRFDVIPAISATARAASPKLAKESSRCGGSPSYAMQSIRGPDGFLGSARECPHVLSLLRPSSIMSASRIPNPFSFGEFMIACLMAVPRCAALYLQLDCRNYFWQPDMVPYERNCS